MPWGMPSAEALKAGWERGGRGRGVDGRRSARIGGSVLLVQSRLCGERAGACHSGGMGRVIGGGHQPRSRRRPAIVWFPDKTGAIQIQRPFAAVFAQFLFKVDFRGKWWTTCRPTRSTRCGARSPTSWRISFPELGMRDQITFQSPFPSVTVEGFPELPISFLFPASCTPPSSCWTGTGTARSTQPTSNVFWARSTQVTPSLSLRNSSRCQQPLRPFPRPPTQILRDEDIRSGLALECAACLA